MLIGDSMFTGIIEDVGEIKSLIGNKIVVSSELMVSDVKLGDSICVNGVCLTVISFDESTFSVEAVPETFRKSNLGTLEVNSLVNLERAMPPNGRFGGHFVQGHIDAIAQVSSIEPDGLAEMIYFQLDDPILKYIVQKGFVCVDGTSLTVVDCTDDGFSITLIPHTKANTKFRDLKVGDTVNLESDIVAKYVEKLFEK